MFDFLCAVTFTSVVALFFYFLFSRREKKKEGFLHDVLDVPKVYKWNAKLLDQTCDLYFDQLTRAETNFCKKNNLDPSGTTELPAYWMKQMTEHDLQECKRRLMERSLAWVDCYKKMDIELKRSSGLYKRGMVVQSYWDSIKRCEHRLEDEYQDVRREALMLDPVNGPSLFQEAIKFHSEYGFPHGGELGDGEGELTDEQLERLIEAKGQGKGANLAANLEEIKRSTKGKGKGGLKGSGKGADDIAQDRLIAPDGVEMPPGLFLEQEEYMKVVEKCTDEETYYITQGPSDLELSVYIPHNTKAKNIKCIIQSDSISVNIPSASFQFTRKLKSTTPISPSDSTWVLSQKSLNDVGEKITLKGLSTASMNGQTATISKPTASSSANGRVPVILDNPEKKLISVKPDNIENPNNKLKCLVVLSLEKVQKRAVYAMPPWESAYSEKLLVRPGVDDCLEIKLAALNKFFAEHGVVPGMESFQGLEKRKELKSGSSKHTPDNENPSSEENDSASSDGAKGENKKANKETAIT